MAKSGRHVLVVEEDKTTRCNIVEGLTEQGYLVHQAVDRESAAQWLQKNRPDLVFLAVDFIGNALTLTDESVTSLTEIPIIAIVSEHTPARVIADALQLGAQSWVLAPVDDRQLLADITDRAIHSSGHKNLTENTTRLQEENCQLRDTVKKLEMDQQAGRKVQSKLLPVTPITFKNLDVSYKVIPSLYLSGDFIDYGFSADRYFAFYLTDVSGHGAASAFVTAWLKQLVTRFFTEQKIFHTEESFKRDTAHLMKLMNREVLRARLDCHLTCFVGVIDTETGEMRYVVAGHLPLPLLICNGRAEYLEGKGKPVGIFEDAEWQVKMLNLPLTLPYSLVAFSDGILEVLPPPDLIEKEAYLRQALSAHSGDINSLCETLNITGIDTAPDDIAILKIDNHGSV